MNLKKALEMYEDYKNNPKELGPNGKVLGIKIGNILLTPEDLDSMHFRLSMDVPDWEATKQALANGNYEVIEE